MDSRLKFYWSITFQKLLVLCSAMSNEDICTNPHDAIINFLLYRSSDGVLVFFSKSHTEQFRNSLGEKSNCYFFLGDKYEIGHFELRWMQDANYHVTRASRQNSQPKSTVGTNPHSPAVTMRTTIAPVEVTTGKGTGIDYHPGLTTIDIRFSRLGSEIEVLKEVFDDHTKILHILEGNIRQACTDPLMKYENKMKPGDRLELQMRVVLKPSYKVSVVVLVLVSGCSAFKRELVSKAMAKSFLTLATHNLASKKKNLALLNPEFFK